MLDDLRSAFRTLRRDPVATLVIALTMALAIGANAAIFSAIQGVLVRPFRFPGGERTVLVWRSMTGRDVRVSPSAAQIAAWRDAPAFERFEAYHEERVTWTSSGPARSLRVARIAPTLTAMVDAQPVLGRGFTDDDATAGAEPVALISTALWNARFGGSPNVLGQVMTLDGVAHTVVGVLPRRFSVPSPVPQEWDAARPLVPGPLGLTAAAILREGVTIEQAEAQLSAIPVEGDLSGQWQPSLMEPRRMARSLESPLIMLGAAVGLLLLIACINVANVLLVRAHARRREVAVQAALGAPRSRLFRQALLGALLLGLLGGVGGVLLAVWLADALLAFRPDDLALLDRIVIDRRVLAFTAAASIGAGILFGLAPALQAARPDALDALRSGVRAGSSRIARRFRLGLVVVEVALSFVLLAGAALLLRSVAEMNRVDPGFEANGLAVLQVATPEWKYDDTARTDAYFDRLADALRAIPGVERISVSGGTPPRGGIYFGNLELDGRPVPDLGGQSVFFGSSADAEYFATLGQPVVDGRAFTVEEIAAGSHVWILGQSTARQLFGNESAVGRRARLDPTSEWSTIVGVVGDVKATGLDEQEDRLQLYTPREGNIGGATVLVRTRRDAEALLPVLQRTAASVDPDVVMEDVATMEALLAGSISRQRFVATLLLAFAALAATLVGIGIYGVLAHLVRLRTREIGIRMALGARTVEVVRMVVRQGGGAVLAGIFIGVPAALLGSRLLASQLFGVGRADPPAYLAAALLLGVVALLAIYLPARRAAAVQPTEAIRQE